MGKRRERDGAYKTHVFDVPAGTDPDTVMHPLYLVHYGEDLTPGDMLIIRCEDGLWEREARVDFVSNAEVKLSARRTDKDGVVRYTAFDPGTAVEYHKKWISPPVQYGVFRGDSKTPLRTNLNAAQADAYLVELRGRKV